MYSLVGLIFAEKLQFLLFFQAILSRPNRPSKHVTVTPFTQTRTLRTFGSSLALNSRTFAVFFYH